MTEREPWEAPDDPDADDTMWRGDAHPAPTPWQDVAGLEYTAYLEMRERDDALRELLGNARIIDDPDGQC